MAKSRWVLSLGFLVLMSGLAAHAVPIITNEEIVSLTDTTAIITWATTNENSDSNIFYGITTPATQYTSSESVLYHHAVLTGLSPGTLYKYYIKSGATQGTEKAFITLTPPSGQYLFSFATIADPQYGMGKNDTQGARGRPYSKSADILNATIPAINSYSPAFTILKGDIIESFTDTGDTPYGDYVNTTNIPGDTQTIKQKFDGLTMATDAGARYYPIPGNHDKIDAAYSAGTAGRRWYDNNLNPLYPTLAVSDPTQDSCFNYSFDYRGYRFIMLDSLRASLSAEVNVTYLTAQLSAAQTAGLKCFIFLHHPITDIRSEGIPTEVLSEVLGGGAVDYNKIQISNTTEVWSLVNTYKNIIAGVFSGHIHDNHYEELYGVPCVRTAAGIQFPVGFNIYKVYANGYMQTFYKIPYWTEIARLQVTPEAGYSDAYWEQFGLGPSSHRNFVHTLSAIPPSVSYTTPASRETGVPLNNEVQIIFTKAMNQADTQNAVTFSPDVSNKSYRWISSNSLAISHDAFSASTAYVVTVGTGAKDTSNVAMSPSYSFNFTSGSQSDSTPPQAYVERFSLNIVSDNQPTVTGIATDESSEITSIECRIDNGSFFAATPFDGSFNSKTERFSFRAQSALLRGTNVHTIEVRCLDNSGNINVSSFSSYSFYVVGDKPEISIKSNGQTIISGDPVERQPSFEVTVISNKGLTANPLQAILDNSTAVNLTKSFDPANAGILTAIYNPTLDDGVHSLRISIVDNSNNLSSKEVVGLVVQSSSDISIQGIPLSYPNPYRGTGNVTLSYILSKNSNISITIHDLMGNQLVRKVYLTGQTGGKAGYNEITWDSKTDGGEELGNGIYIYLIVADGKIISKGKLTVVR